MNLLQKLMFAFVFMLIIFSFNGTQIQAGLLKSVTENISDTVDSLADELDSLTGELDSLTDELDDTIPIIVTPTETVLKEIVEEVEDIEVSLMPEKLNLSVSDIKETVNDVSELIETTTNTITHAIENVVEEVDGIVSITESLLDVVEHTLLLDVLVDNISNMTTEQIDIELFDHSEPEQETEMQAIEEQVIEMSSTDRSGHHNSNEMDGYPSSKRNPVELKTELNTELNTEHVTVLDNPDEKLEAASSSPCCQKPLPTFKEININSTGSKTLTKTEIEVGIKPGKKKADPPREPKRSNVPVPIGAIITYTFIPSKGKTGSKTSGFHCSTGNCDATLVDSIQIKLTSQRGLVSRVKQFVSNRANEPPELPPKKTFSQTLINK